MTLRTHAPYSPPSTPGVPVAAEPRFAVLAAALVERDWSTLDSAEAIRQATRLGELCERVAVAAGYAIDDATHHVFYHPAEQAFKAHAAKARPASAASSENVSG